ncbi:MAG: hypothetical protein HOO99_14680 [Hyphomicrobiaceae bacterium]|nr:hypothetical protein [Hyphomicrobiaceae bacterium]
MTAPRTVINRPLKSVEVYGGTLFAVAAQEYGDATQWNRIARANGIVDPWLLGPTKLVIPPADPSGGNGGIYTP